MKRNVTESPCIKHLRKSVQNYQSAISTGDQTSKQGEAYKDTFETAFEDAANSMHDIGVVLHHLEQPICRWAAG
jgi:hypothetical protein